MSKRTVSGITLTLLLIGMLTSTFNIQLANTQPETNVIPDCYPTVEEAEKKKSFVDNILLIETHAVNDQVVISPDPAEGSVGDLVEWYVSFDVTTVLLFATHVKISVGMDPVSGKNPWGMSFSRESPMISRSILGWRWDPPEPANTSGLFPYSVGIFYEIDPDIFIRLWEGNGTIILKRLIIVPDDYPTIQEAINNASEGDTIYVRNGTYYENVVVNKSVSLIGEGREVTVIDGKETDIVVYLKANNIMIRGFTVRNGRHGLGGMTIDSLFGSSTIDNNLITSNCHGIELWSSHNNSVRNNIIRGNQWYGIWTNYCEDNAFRGNILTGNKGGLRIFYPGSNTLCGNYIVNNSEFGINLHGSHNNIITTNTIAENGNGIYVDGMYIGYSSGDNYFCHNNIVNNTNQIYISGSPDNVWDNDCEGNYWSDYNGTDSDNNGIGDAPYVINGNNTDRHPLMNPYWNPGDVDHDLDVDLYDAVRLLLAYSSTPEDERYNCHCDITEPYGIIDLYDAVLLLVNYGKKYS